MPAASVTSAHTAKTARSPLAIRNGLLRNRPTADASAAYTATQKAIRMASEPTFSMLTSLLDGAFAGVDIRRGLAGFELPRFGLVLRRAFGLNLGGAKNAVGVEFAVRQRLRAVAEGIGQRFGAGIGHFEREFVLRQDELNFFTHALDGSRGHI